MKQNERRTRLGRTSQEVRSQAADEPLDEDLKDGAGDQAVEQAKFGGVKVSPKAADTDLHDEEEERRDDPGEQSGEPDWDDVLPTLQCHDQCKRTQTRVETHRSG